MWRGPSDRCPGQNTEGHLASVSGQTINPMAMDKQRVQNWAERWGGGGTLRQEPGPLQGSGPGSQGWHDEA